jgi:hypothetical protein
MLRAYMHVCETMYIQASLGVGDTSIWRAEEDGLKQLLAAPGIRDWWTENPYGFCAAFRGYVATLAPPAETPP